ncbi:hypothetical protein HRbin24_01066 [bacterium HR24]|nr:hypothetical protein HRbin24_01066 [bacterium HR24]
MEVFRWDATWYQHNAAHFWDALGTTRIPALELVQPGAGPPGLTWTAYWPPGYTAVLGAVYLLAGGPDLTAAEVFQAALGAVAVLLVFLAATALMGRGVGLTAALLLALFPGHALYAPVIMTETLASFLVAALLVAMVWLLRRQTPPPLWAAAGLGLLVGGSSLVRGEFLPLGLACLALLVLRYRPRRRAVLWAGAAGLALALPLSAWTARNLVVLDAPVVISTGAADAFWDAHRPGATGLPSFGAAADQEQRLADVPYPRREVTTARIRLREGVRYLITHPAQEARLWLRKLYLLHRDDSSALDYITAWGQDAQVSQPVARALARAANGYWYAVLALCFFSLPLWWRAQREAGMAASLPLLFVTVWVLVIAVLFLGQTRYHVPLAPAYAVLAAPALAFAVEKGSKWPMAAFRTSARATSGQSRP